MNDFRIPNVGKTASAYCTHNATKTVILPAENSRHYARLECADCSAFLKFLPRPENVERRKLNGYKLAKLQMHAGLNAWERDFVASLSEQGNKFTPKQQAVFDRLCSTYLKGGAQNEG
jgi:hypothetical protein